MDENYITEEEFLDRCNKGETYEGYIIGVGFAYIHVIPCMDNLTPNIRRVPVKDPMASVFSLYPVERQDVYQYIDTSNEQVMKSFKKDSIVHPSYKGESIVVLEPFGHKSELENLDLSLNLSQGSSHSALNDFPQLGFSQVGGSKIPQLSFTQVGASRPSASNMKKKVVIPKSAEREHLGTYSYVNGNVTLLENTYENFIYDFDHYTQTDGKKGIWYKTNKKGEKILKNGKPIPKSQQAANKLFRNNMLKGFGKSLGGVGILLTILDMRLEKQETGKISLENKANLIYGVIGTFGGFYGFLISLPWAIGNTFYHDWTVTPEYYDYCTHTNTD